MIERGLSGTFETAVEERHTAHALGNTGVHVLATPSLTHFCQRAAADTLRPHLQDGQMVLGLRNTVRHLKASPRGGVVRLTATVQAVDDDQITLSVEAVSGGITLMSGTHQCRIVDRAAFLAAAGA